MSRGAPGRDANVSAAVMVHSKRACQIGPLTCRSVIRVCSVPVMSPATVPTHTPGLVGSKGVSKLSSTDAVDARSATSA